MARTIAQIKSTLDSAQAAEPNLTQLNSPSQTAIFNLWKYITAVAIYTHEVLLDLFKEEIETTVASAPVATESWVQEKCFEFQYDATTPQIVQLPNFVPGYDPVDITKRIITRASVKTLPNKIVSVKLAKSEPPTALTTPELNSIQGYLSTISPAGVQYTTTSTLPDFLYCDADVYYNGQYTSIISATTISAITSYLSSIPFDGVIRISALEDAIQNVPGVTDIVLNNVSLRANSVPFSGATYLVQNNTTLIPKQSTVSGYVVGDNAPNSFATSLTFIIE